LSRIISITNQKGGVGKTTTAVNLGASLAAFEKKVLILDADPQANASLGLGITIDKSRSIYDIFAENCSIEESVYPLKYFSSFHIIPSSQDLSGLEVELASENNRTLFLKKITDTLINTYDYIIIDTPPTLGLLTINALCAADSIIITMQPEFYALDGLNRLMKTFKTVKNNFNPSLFIEGIVFTLVDTRLNLGKEVMEEVRQYFKEKVFTTVIPRNIRLAEAPSHGKPVILYDVSSTGAKSYKSLAKELLDKEKEIYGKKEIR